MVLPIGAARRICASAVCIVAGNAVANAITAAAASERFFILTSTQHRTCCPVSFRKRSTSTLSCLGGHFSIKLGHGRLRRGTLPGSIPPPICASEDVQSSPQRRLHGAAGALSVSESTRLRPSREVRL